MSAAKQPSFVDLAARLAEAADPIRVALLQFAHQLRVSAPGIIQKFDPVRQTVEVQLAIRERIRQNLVPVDLAILPLVDVPVVLYGGGGFTVCPPITKGDECLVIFGDRCIDTWWKSGGIQNQPRSEHRVHDLSDGFAIVGLRSQPRKLVNYSTSALQVRSDNGNTVLEVGPSGISATPDNGTTQLKITPGEIDLTANAVKIHAGTIVEISGGAVTLQGKGFLTHVHIGVQTGSGDSGPVA